MQHGKSLISGISVNWYAFWLACAWTFVTVISLLWNLSEQREQIKELAVTAARINFEKDLLYRRWSAVHGGVYVPVTQVTQPNPYLSHIPERDIVMPSGKHLTLINPALMVRQVSEFSKEKSTVHITSLHPINPGNSPDTFEAEALAAFEKGVKEYSGIMDLDGKSYMRFMRPFITEKSCLKCHETQGYREGDIRGGMSVSIPMAPLWEVRDRFLLIIWLSHGLIWLLGLTGITLGWRRISRSLAEQREAEEKLAKSEATFKTLSNSSPIGVFLNDADGHCLYTNPRWQTITGLSIEGGLGESWTKAVHPEDREAVVSRWRECVEETREYIHEFRLARPDGEVRWVEARAACVFSEKGQFDGYVGTMTDVTQQKAAQEELIRSRKTEAIGILAGGVAHDFNNLLTVILGNINLAQACLDKESCAARPLGEAGKSVELAGKLTRQFLALSAGQELMKSPERVEELLLGAADLALNGSNVECLHSFSEDLWYVEVDRAQISRAFSNVIVNAKEAMLQGGVIRIGAENINVLSDRLMENVLVQEGRYVKISIRDEGVGIPRENLEKIFDPYFSTKSTYNQKGLGMSLAKTRLVITRHEGYIGAESEVNSGTTFHIYLPASRH